MLVPFNHLPPTSRLWVYQANRVFTKVEREIIEEEAKAFCENWLAHGQPLKTSFKIEHDLFLILSVDESMSGASGCSIDGSVRMLKELQAKIGIDLFDRTNIPFLVNGAMVVFKLIELKGLFADGILTSESISFNNAVTSKHDFVKNWLTPVNNSWLAKYLPKRELA